MKKSLWNLPALLALFRRILRDFLWKKFFLISQDCHVSQAVNAGNRPSIL